MKLTLAKILLRKGWKLPILLEICFNLQLLKKMRLIVTGSYNSFRNQRFMREKFSKNDIRENISQKLHDQWKIG